MAFGAHEPPRTRRRPRPCRANPHCGGAPTNAALKGGIPESVSSRSTAESGSLRFIVEHGSVAQYVFGRWRASGGVKPQTGRLVISFSELSTA